MNPFPPGRLPQRPPNADILVCRQRRRQSLFRQCSAGSRWATITVDPEVHAGVVAAASDEGLSVSAWMTNAARRALLVRDGLKVVAEWEADHGPLSETELANARMGVAEELGKVRPRGA